MTLIALSVNELALEQLGKEKSVEGRLCKGKIKEIKPGNHIKFINRSRPDKPVMTKVVDVRHYDSILKMLEAEGLENVLPSRGVSCVQRRRRIL